jgi:predicted CXXCH cytochrome family protein
LLQGPQIQPAGATTTGAARWVAQKTQAAAQTLFEDPKGACKTCHTIERLTDPDAKAPWKVQPVLNTTIWLPKARFSHAQHANAACTSCHAATTSRNSTDVLIPAIDVCRHCHTGTQVETRDLIQQDKVASACNLCHSFHASVVHASFKAEKARLAASATTSSQP